MKDPSSTYQELIEEISFLKHRIKELEQSESDLKKSELRFRSLSEAALEATVFIEAGIIVDANEALNRLFGYEGEELRGKSAADFIAPEKRPFTIEKMLTRTEGTYETLGLRKDGSTFPIEVNPHEFEHEGKRLRISAVRDITERQRAVEALAESERLYRTLFETANDAIFLHKGYRIFDCNQKACDLHGVTRDQIIGKEPHEVSPVLQPGGEESSKKAREKIDQAFQGKPQHFEWSHCIGGKRHDVEMTLKAVEMGGERYVMAVSRDITERKRAEEELQTSEERFRALSEAVFGGVVIHEQGIILECNQGLSDITGYSYDELIGMQGFGLIAPESLDTVLANVRNMYEQAYDVTGLRKDGSRYPVSIRGKQMTFRGRNVRVVEFFDITERKLAEAEREKLQAQLAQAQRMESVGRLAGGVAHDFNNMLGVILGHTELAMRKIGPDESLYADLDEIRKAAGRSADLTGQLLAFARKQTVTPKVLDLNEMVEGMLQMLRRLIGEDIELAWLPGAHLGPVFIDPSQVDQVLANLCVNARDAIAGTGRLTIETNNIVFDEEYCSRHAGFVPGEYVILAVSDDGYGMDAETQSRLFEPFFTTKEMGKGTGLGLATIYGIVTQNNGFINVYSEPGYGTTFSIYLPRHAAGAVPRTEQEHAPNPTPGNETILLVEDEPAILSMTTLMLEGMGYAVISAGTPGEAIRLAREHKGQIDLLMTDVVMPEMNGRDLARNLMSIYPDIKRLFMSGYTADVIAHHGVLDEGVHFIQKPFSMKDLAAKIREALDRE